MDARDRLIVALDLPTVVAAEAMVSRLGASVSSYKIGYELAFAGGLPFAAGLIAAGKQVFLDFKLHDIANTVTKGVESVAQIGATFLTVHAYPQTMKAAVEGKRGSKLRILAVTALTSYDDADLFQAGYKLGVSALVVQRAGQARELGVDGLCNGLQFAVTGHANGAALLWFQCFPSFFIAFNALLLSDFFQLFEKVGSRFCSVALGY